MTAPFAVPQRPTALKASKASLPGTPVRRPTLVRKRNDMELDAPLSSTPPSPSKRAKVSFSDNVEMNVIDEWEKAPQVIREEVRFTLERHARNDNVGYEELKSIFSREDSDDRPTPTTLKNHTAALIAQVSMLGRSNTELVHAVLASDWVRRDEGYVTLFLRFLGNLVSAQGVWLADALKMLVDKFVNNLRLKRPLVNQPNITAAQIQKRAHSGLRYLLRLVPSGSNVLSSILTHSFPDASDSKRTLFKYARNLLQIIDYAPELHSEILALITQRLVKIDVQVQGDLEDLAEDVGEGLLENLPQLGDGTNDTEEREDDVESEPDDEDFDPEAQRAKDITSNVEKLDVILDILFAHYSNLFNQTSSTASFSAASTLLSHFSTLILPTYRSRHTQFLLFHFMQGEPSLVDTFVGTCITLSFDKSRPALIRESAAAYLASFVARGAHVPRTITVDVFKFIGEQLDLLRADYEPSCRGPDPRRYHTFYSLTQALLYIFCFRWRDLVVDADEDSIDMSPPGIAHAMIGADEENEFEPTFLTGIKDILHANLFSPLNPLRVCTPIIVNEFAHIARRLKLLYVFHVIETNKRVRLVHSVASSFAEQRESALSARRDEDWMCLDAYFPFDPYKLPRSKRWLEGDYREWQGLDPEGDERDESDDGDDDDDDEDDSADEVTGTEDDDEVE